MAKEKEDAVVQTTVATPAKTKYRRVIFNERTNDMEPETLIFSHNGSLPLKVKRGVEVVLPDYILAIARDARVVYQNENGGFTVINRATYHDKGEATEEEFLMLKNSGTAATKKAIEAKMQEASR